MQPQSPPSQTPVPGQDPQMATLPGVQPIPAAPAPIAPIPGSQSAAATQSTAAKAGAADAPALADDGDLIEKEWVVKVKQVVRATAQDPYEQNLQFTKLKADYMQKRYGKSIKLD